MFEKKKLIINTDVCDTRTMKEEDYTKYEEIIINTDILIVSANSKSILNRLPLTINKDQTVETENTEKMQVKNVNGSYEITKGTPAANNVYLCINGALTIEEGTEEILDNYFGINVNGIVKYPKGLEGHLSHLTVNGTCTSYPDGYTLLKREFIMDEYFPLRARENGRYYADTHVIIPSPKTDLKKLVEKKVQMITPTLVVLQSQVEAAAALFDESAEFIVVPDEFTIIPESCVLTADFIAKNGDCLYVYGDVKIPADTDFDALKNTLKKLTVTECLTVPKAKETLFRELEKTAKIDYKELKLEKDTRKIENCIKAKVDCKLLESAPDGASLLNIVNVVIAKDVPPEMLLEKLTLENCVSVLCTEEQESAVAAVSKNVNSIGSTPGMIEDVMHNALDTFFNPQAKVVNSDYHIM